MAVGRAQNGEERVRARWDGEGVSSRDQVSLGGGCPPCSAREPRGFLNSGNATVKTMTEQDSSCRSSGSVWVERD